ncbi:hypothetical protein I4F81_009447 [Pyropia yezoensis]|uniref:Uncharacterized protein n=1 Tax=Pyropia yezoensis TaxID=2788 RepID=A0ACC3C9Y8_PYRYE|nr:hypothetical protein I4F81_009447 [Neopyropia yezoensis]
MAPGCDAIVTGLRVAPPAWPYTCAGWRYAVRYAGCLGEASAPGSGGAPVMDAFRLQVWSAPAAGAGAPAGRPTLEAESIEVFPRAARLSQTPLTRMARRCGARTWYAEACVVPAGGGGVAACARSPPVLHAAGLVRAPAVTVVAPLPPRRLALAPGDRVHLSTTVAVVPADADGCAAAVTPADLRLVTVVRRADGSTRRSAAVVGVATITTRVAVTAADDGGVVYVEVSHRWCAAAAGRTLSTDTLQTGATALSVSAATPALVVQDTALPAVEGVRTDCGRVEGTYRCVAGPGWAVDVCNTGGCTRVAAAPAIRRPPAAKWQTRWMLSAGCRWAD